MYINIYTHKHTHTHTHTHTLYTRSWIIAAAKKRSGEKKKRFPIDSVQKKSGYGDGRRKKSGEKKKK